MILAILLARHDQKKCPNTFNYIQSFIPVNSEIHICQTYLSRAQFIVFKEKGVTSSTNHTTHMYTKHHISIHSCNSKRKKQQYKTKMTKTIEFKIKE